MITCKHNGAWCHVCAFFEALLTCMVVGVILYVLSFWIPLP